MIMGKILQIKTCAISSKLYINRLNIDRDLCLM